MEIKIIHMFYILIVILFVVLMNNYAVEGIDNLNLNYVKKMTSEDSIKYCDNLRVTDKIENPNCLSKFYYNTDTDKIEACFGYNYDISSWEYGVDCHSPHYIPDKPPDNWRRDRVNFIKDKANCEGPSKTCPTCDDNSFYSLDENHQCTDNLDICNRCLTSDNISWNNPNSYSRTYYGNAEEGQEYAADISYTGENPLKDCSNTTEFCSQQQSGCFSAIREAIADIKGNGNGECSNKSILKTIERRNIISTKCKYDKVPVVGEDVWLKQFLETDRYCDPTATDDWKCQRDLPKYCKNKDDCEYDMNAKKCICRPPNEVLNTGGCGIPTCGNKASSEGSSSDTCPQGEGTCHSEVIPGPDGRNTTIWSCKK